MRLKDPGTESLIRTFGICKEFRILNLGGDSGYGRARGKVVKGQGPNTFVGIPNFRLSEDLVSDSAVKGEGKKGAGLGDPKKGSERPSPPR